MDKTFVSGSFDLRATRSEPNLPATWYHGPVYSVLVEHPDGLLLWDTGAPRDWESRWKASGLAESSPYEYVEEHEYLDSQLDLLGFDASDIRVVVLSHLHFDHVGNAHLFDNGRTQILVNVREKEGALAFEGASFGGYIKADYSELDMVGIEGEVEIMPGVRVFDTPGHTWGTMSMYVDLPTDGPLIFTSDSIFMEENIGPPHTCGISVWDKRLWASSVEKLLDLKSRTNGRLIFGHDLGQMQGLSIAPSGFYS